MIREDAIHFANCLKNNYTIDLNDMQDFCDMAIKALEQESRKGHWIPYLKEGLIAKCSECGSRFSLGYNFCPNCGADMREVEGMTNGEKMISAFPNGEVRKVEKGVVFSTGGWCHAYAEEWWNAECEEPTTKNDLGVDCISRADARSLVVKIDRKYMYGMSGKAFQDLYKGIDELPPVTPQPCEDAVSRQAVLNYIYNDLGLGDEENGKDVERQMELESSYRYIKSLPLVTPQEPTNKIEESNFSQEQYLADIQSAYDCGKSVLDRIRAEIERLTIVEGGDDYVRKMAELFSFKVKVLQIIDKYKADRSVEDGND